MRKFIVLLSLAVGSWLGAGRLPAQTTSGCLTLNCPGRLVAECAGTNGTPVEFTVTATSTCGTNVTVTCVPPSGSSFAYGSNQVLCTATDSAGNLARCEFLETGQT